MWSVLCCYMLSKTPSFSPTRYKRGLWQTIVKQWRKQGKQKLLSQFDLLFCGVASYYTGNCIFEKKKCLWNALISTSDLFHFWWVSWHIYDASLQHNIQEGSISSSVSIVVSTRETWSSKSFECVSKSAALLYLDYRGESSSCEDNWADKSFDFGSKTKTQKSPQRTENSLHTRPSRIRLVSEQSQRRMRASCPLLCELLIKACWFVLSSVNPHRPT